MVQLKIFLLFFWRSALQRRYCLGARLGFTRGPTILPGSPPSRPTIRWFTGVIHLRYLYIDMNNLRIPMFHPLYSVVLEDSGYNNKIKFSPKNILTT